MPSVTPQTETTPTRPRKRDRAKALIARLRHQQVLAALSGQVMESAIYAQRTLRVREAYQTCPCRP